MIRIVLNQVGTMPEETGIRVSTMRLHRHHHVTQPEIIHQGHHRLPAVNMKDHVTTMEAARAKAAMVRGEAEIRLHRAEAASLQGADLSRQTTLAIILNQNIEARRYE